MIRVVVVDDQRLVRDGIVGLLELADDIEIVGQAGDGAEALEVIDRTSPEVTLLDLQMPGVDGLGVLEALHDRVDGPRVLVLTTFDDDTLVLRALELGAHGYLLKDVSLEQLLQAVRTIADGGRVAQPAMTDRLRRAWGRRDEAPVELAAPPALTARELDVLRLVAAGYPNRDIAAALHLAEGTVKNHVSNVLVKLGARDRTRAVLTALGLGLLD